MTERHGTGEAKQLPSQTGLGDQGEENPLSDKATAAAAGSAGDTSASPTIEEVCFSSSLSVAYTGPSECPHVCTAYPGAAHPGCVLTEPKPTCSAASTAAFKAIHSTIKVILVAWNVLYSTARPANQHPETGLGTLQDCCAELHTPECTCSLSRALAAVCSLLCQLVILTSAVISPSCLPLTSCRASKGLSKPCVTMLTDSAAQTRMLLSRL